MDAPAVLQAAERADAGPSAGFRRRAGACAVRGDWRRAGQTVRPEESRSPRWPAPSNPRRSGRAGTASWRRPRRRTARRSMAGTSCQPTPPNLVRTIRGEPSSPWSGWARTFPQTPSTHTPSSTAQVQPLSGANRYVIRFPEGQTAAGERLLVHHDVQREAGVRAEPHRTLCHRRSRQAADGGGWIRDDLRAARLPGEGSGIELAAGAARFVQPVHAALLAEQAIIDGTWKPPAVERVP